MYLFVNRLKKPGYVFASLLTPLLYLVTFGLGLGKRVSIEGSSYLLFIIPGICAMSTMTNAFTGIASSLAVGRLHFKSIEEILVSPVAYRDIAIGEILGGTVRGLFSSLFILLAALIMGAHLPVNFLFYITWIITAVLFAALGVVAGFKAKSHDDTSVFSNFIIMPMSLFCGTFFPVDSLPAGISHFINALPLTHAVMCMRAGYQNLQIPYWHLGILVIFCIAAIWWSIIAIRQSLK
jgi:ABC-type multidrug transport system permease subunit